MGGIKVYRRFEVLYKGCSEVIEEKLWWLKERRVVGTGKMWDGLLTICAKTKGGHEHGPIGGVTSHVERLDANYSRP